MSQRSTSSADIYSAGSFWDQSFGSYFKWKIINIINFADSYKLLFSQPKKYEKDRFALNEGIDENNNSQRASQHSRFAQKKD